MVELRAALTGAVVSALVLAAVVAPAASAAAAAVPVAAGWDVITVAPASSRPGGTVDLRTFADCGGTETGSVTSAAFAAPVSLGLAADGGLYAEARVAGNAAPGSYPVRELCDGKAVAVGTLTLADLGAPDTGGGWGATRGAAAVVGGDALGGSAGRASLALIGAAALGGLVRLRRRVHG
jgi:hypothetical protein